MHNVEEEKKRRVGNSAWALLHIMPYSAVGSSEVVNDETVLYKRFVRALFKSYPCKECRRHIKTHKDFRNLLKNYTPDTGDEVLQFPARGDPHLKLVMWAFRFHHVVNVHLHKVGEWVELGERLEESIANGEGDAICSLINEVLEKHRQTWCPPCTQCDAGVCPMKHSPNPAKATRYGVNRGILL